MRDSLTIGEFKKAIRKALRIAKLRKILGLSVDPAPMELEGKIQTYLKLNSVTYDQAFDQIMQEEIEGMIEDGNLKLVE